MNLFSRRFQQQWRGVLPRIHVYAFSTCTADPVSDIVRRTSGVLQCTPEAVLHGSGGSDGSAHTCSGHIVRDVSPKKVMVCLSFTLPLEVAEAQPLDFSSGTSKGTKRDSVEAEL